MALFFRRFKGVGALHAVSRASNFIPRAGVGVGVAVKIEMGAAMKDVSAVTN